MLHANPTDGRVLYAQFTRKNNASWDIAMSHCEVFWILRGFRGCWGNVLHTNPTGGSVLYAWLTRKRLLLQQRPAGTAQTSGVGSEPGLMYEMEPLQNNAA